MEADVVVEATKRWISEIVIGLNLCPFARRVFDANRIRYCVSDATDDVMLIRDLARELKTLAEADRATIETTILIHPKAMLSFREYNDFLGTADELLDELGYDGQIQVASFHPDYQFAGTAKNAVENYTNRSPFPMLHLLREISITEVSANPDDLLMIPERNIETLKAIGMQGMRERLKNLNPPR